jgi:DnaB-like helicase N terminal domain
MTSISDQAPMPYDDYAPPDEYSRNGDGRDEPPQDGRAEQAVLGGMMLSRNVIADVVASVRTADFYQPAHQNIFAAILDLYGRGEPADAVTVAAELDTQKQLRRCGGAPYLLTLIQLVPTALNAGYYARLVADKARLRTLIATGDTLRQYGYSGAADDDVAATITRAISDLTDTNVAALQTTWTPVDLGPYLDGDIELPQPIIGIRRSDGQRFIYPGCDHSVIGPTESGKSWWVCGCAAAELRQDRRVLYVHFEEADPSSTIERLRLLGVDDALLDPRLDTCRFAFVGPDEAPNDNRIRALLNPTPALVILDGVNEAISMLGGETNKTESASEFRRQLAKPFLRAGSAVISCDHVPYSTDRTRTAAIGTVHKGNALSGSRINIENTQPFGRGMRGASRVYITKDRPGFLRASGQPSTTPGKTYVGSLVIDEQTPEFMMFYQPRADDPPTTSDPGSQLAETVWAVIASTPDRRVTSLRDLYAQMRATGAKFTEAKAREAVDDLVVLGRLRKTNGTGYETVESAADDVDDEAQ